MRTDCSLYEKEMTAVVKVDDMDSIDQRGMNVNG